MPDVKEIDAGPAHSATSDKPNAPQQKADASNEGAPPKEDKDKAAAAASDELDDGETTGESATPPGEGAAAGGPKKKGGFQRRIDELSREAREANERYERAMLVVERLTGGKQPAEGAQPQQKEDPKPERSQFEDPDKFTEALVAWTGKRAAQAAINEERGRNLHAAILQAQQQLQSAYDERVAKVKEKHPDWEAKVMTNDVEISVPMAQEIVTLEHGPLVALYLSEHKEEAKRISKLDERSAVREMARIEMKVSTAPKPEVSNAPDPVKPVGTRNKAGPKSPEEESTEEYAARRNREIADQKRPPGRRAAT